MDKKTTKSAAVALASPFIPESLSATYLAAGACNVSLIVLSGPHSRSLLSGEVAGAMEAWSPIPSLFVEDAFQAVPHLATPVAIEFAEDEDEDGLTEFMHPDHAFYIFGCKDADRCRERLRLNSKYRSNLASAVNAVLTDRIYKQGPKYEVRRLR